MAIQGKASEMNGLSIREVPMSPEEQAALVQDALRYNLELFSNEREIWADQCDLAASHLATVKVLVQGYCNFSYNECFSATEKLDNDFLVPLSYACDQLEELYDLITAFQPLCRASSKQRHKRRTEIQSKLKLFMHNSDDILTFLQAKTVREDLTDAEAVSPPEKGRRSYLQPIAGGRSKRSPAQEVRPRLEVVYGGGV
jgi:hypothetical protein